MVGLTGFVVWCMMRVLGKTGFISFEETVMDFKEMLDTHMERFERFSDAATRQYHSAEYAQLAEAESRIIAALIAKM